MAFVNPNLNDYVVSHNKFGAPHFVPTRADKASDKQPAGQPPFQDNLPLNQSNDYSPSAKSYSLGIRDNELIEYNYPWVKYHVAFGNATEGIALSSRSAHKYKFLYDTPEKTISILGQTSVVLGGVKIPNGHLWATVRNFRLTDDNSTHVALLVRNPENLSLITDTSIDLISQEPEQGQDAEQFKIDIGTEIGLLHANQVRLNSCVCRAKVIGNQSVHVENSALYNSLLESNQLVHIERAQIIATINAPIVHLDTHTILDGVGSNIINASQWLVITRAKFFAMEGTNFDDELPSFVSLNYPYAIQNTKLESPCITIEHSSVSGCSIISPQTRFVNNKFADCNIVCSTSGLAVDESRGYWNLDPDNLTTPIKSVFHDVDRPGRLIGVEFPGGQVNKLRYPIMRSANRSIQPTIGHDGKTYDSAETLEIWSWHRDYDSTDSTAALKRLGRPSCGTPLYEYSDTLKDNAGNFRYWQIGCINSYSDNDKNTNPGHFVGAVNSLYGVYPFAQSFNSINLSSTEDPNIIDDLEVDKLTYYDGIRYVNLTTLAGRRRTPAALINRRPVPIAADMLEKRGLADPASQTSIDAYHGFVDNTFLDSTIECNNSTMLYSAKNIFDKKCSVNVKSLCVDNSNVFLNDSELVCSGVYPYQDEQPTISFGITTEDQDPPKIKFLALDSNGLSSDIGETIPISGNLADQAIPGQIVQLELTALDIEGNAITVPVTVADNGIDLIGEYTREGGHNLGDDGVTIASTTPDENNPITRALTSTGAKADIEQLTNTILLAGANSEITLHQESIGGSFGVGALKSNSNSSIILTAPTFTISTTDGISKHRGDYFANSLIIDNPNTPDHGMLFDGTLESQNVLAKSITIDCLHNRGSINTGPMELHRLRNGGTINCSDLTFDEMFENFGAVNASTISGLPGSEKSDSQDFLDNRSVITANTISCRIQNFASITAGTINARAESKINGTIRCETMNLLPDKDAFDNMIGIGETSSATSFAISDAGVSPTVVENGSYTIGELNAFHTSFNDVDFLSGSKIKKVQLVNCNTKGNWLSSENQVDLIRSINTESNINNVTMLDSIHNNGLISNATISGWFSVEGTGSGDISLENGTTNLIDRGLTSTRSFERSYELLLEKGLDLTFKEPQTHTVNIEDTNFSDTPLILVREMPAAIDAFADDGTPISITPLNTLSVTMDNVKGIGLLNLNLDIVNRGLDVNGKTSFNGTKVQAGLPPSREQPDQGKVDCTNVTLESSSFVRINFDILNIAATNTSFNVCDMQVENRGQMTDCTFFGGELPIGSQERNRLFNVNFINERNGRSYPNVGLTSITETFFDKNNEDIGSKNYATTYNPISGVTDTELNRLGDTTCEAFSIYNQTDVFTGSVCKIKEKFDILSADIQNGHYTSVGMKDCEIQPNISMHIIDSNVEDCVIEDPVGDTFLTFNKCFIKNTINKAKHIIADDCTLLGSNNDKGAAVSTTVEGELITTPSLDLRNNTINRSTIHTTVTANVRLQNSKNYGTIIGSEGGNLNTGFHYHGTVNLINSVNGNNILTMPSFIPFTDQTLIKGFIQAQTVGLTNSINENGGKIVASELVNYFGGNTNNGIIETKKLYGNITDGIGSLISLYNTRTVTLNNGDVVPEVLLKTQFDDGFDLSMGNIGGVNSQEIPENSFFVDYGSFLILDEPIEISHHAREEPILTRFVVPDSPTDDIDFSHQPYDCLAEVNSVTINQGYRVNNRSVKRHFSSKLRLHKKIKVYQLRGVPSAYPMGFTNASSIPAISYTGDTLAGFRNGVPYYYGTVYIMVDTSADSDAELLFDTLDDTLTDFEDFEGVFIFTSDPSQCNPAQNPDPDSITNTPFNIHKSPKFREEFGIRVWYNSDHTYLQEGQLRNKTYLVEGIAIDQELNTVVPDSFNGYIFNQIIYPYILHHFLGIDVFNTNNLSLPYILVKDQANFF